ncbi:bestrophin family ion channel [Thermosynechococcus sp.]|uniref:bestrophin family ion channel n=1 Tax=Thermosynechococcus sp. TaxID=2814275 RepID=UPI0039191DEA
MALSFRRFSQRCFSGGFGLLVTVVDLYLINVHWPVLGSLIPSIVLGLLLVFRTNTAYERFWKGRQWGSIVNNFHSLTRLMWTAIDENNPEDHRGSSRQN